METGVDTGVDEGGTVVGTAVVELDGGAGEDAPEPMAVVIGPFSMKTPETYQSSGAGVLTMRRMPTWKSSELVEVEAAMLFATLVSGEEPFEAQRPTVPAENWGRSQLCSGVRMVQWGHGVTYVDVVREVVPLSGLEGCAPLGLATDVPLKVGRVRGNTVLQLGEVGLEEEDLVLERRLQDETGQS